MTVQVSLGEFASLCYLLQSSLPVWYFPDKPLPAPPSPTPPLLCWEEWQPPCDPPAYQPPETEPGSGPKRAWEKNGSSCVGPATKRVRNGSGAEGRASSSLCSSSGAFPPRISHSTSASSRSARRQHQQHPPQLGLSATPWDEKPRLTSDEAAHTNESSHIPHRPYKAPNLVPYHKLDFQDRHCRTTPFKHNKAAFENYAACIKALLSELNKTCDQTFRGVKPDPPRILFRSMAWHFCCHS